MKMKNKISPAQEKIIDTIHNLIWHRITHDDKYLEDIPEIDSKNFHVWIYNMKYEFIEYDDSIIQAVIYLNGKHYEYKHTPQWLNGSIWVNEIDESEVKAKIVELGGEIYDGFELYNLGLPKAENIHNKMDNSEEYHDLPF